MKPSVRQAVALLAACAFPFSLSSAGAAGDTSRSDASAARPNIVLVVTDDQRWDTLWAMPTVQSQLARKGIAFSNGFVVNATCCPSRASILTGKYSHSTRVYNNGNPYGGFKAFKDTSTVATWLSGAGYRTGLFGKYFNQYYGDAGSYVPPGWNRWFAFTSKAGLGGYYGFNVSVNGKIVKYDSSKYSTDVLASEAVSFIKSTGQDRPLFLYLAPTAPHGDGDEKPPVPAARHRDAFADLPRWRPPNYNEADVSDKPAYIRSLSLLSPTSQGAIDAFRLNQYRALLAVDDAVKAILGALSATGRLSNTIFVFTSDNGYLWGEHRARSKLVPYEESIRVPYIVRYDRLVSNPRTEQRLVLNVDLAPTFAALAGVGAPGAEGRSLVPLMTSSTGPWRSDFLIERLRGTKGWISEVPTHCAVRTTRYLYVAHETGERELYDLPADRYQLRNRAKDASYASTVSSLHSRMLQLCKPAPPGF